MTASSRPTLKLADFGLSQKLGNDQLKSTVRGTYLYMAPEIVIDRRYDAKVDLWSVGIILYECLFGRAPYKSETLEQLLIKIKDGARIEIPSDPKISSNCLDLIEKCLQRNPQERIDFDEFFEHPFLDLEHMPSKESVMKAIQLAQEAVEKDKSGDLQQAETLYIEALNYYVPLCQSEKNAQKKSALREQIDKYMKRVEQIKLILNPNREIPNVPSLPRNDPPRSPPVTMRYISRRNEANNVQQRSSTEESAMEELVRLASVTPKVNQLSNSVFSTNYIVYDLYRWPLD